VSVRDAIIIGGGPAGATIAALLASQGHTALVLERERFPRPHVGESLLPCVGPVLARLGVDLTAEGFLVKRGARFTSEAAGQTVRFGFDEGYPDFPSLAWQVDRPLFDALLLRRAAAAGAEVREQVRVRDVDLDGPCVRVVTAEGEALEARYLIDASGQAAVLGGRLRSLTP